MEDVRKVTGPSPEYPPVPTNCVQFPHTCIVSSKTPKGSRTGKEGKGEGDPSHGGIIIPAGYRPSIVAVLRSLMFLTMHPLPYCSVSKPNKLIGSAE